MLIKAILNILTTDKHVAPGFWIKLVPVFRNIGFSEELKLEISEENPRVRAAQQQTQSKCTAIHYLNPG